MATVLLGELAFGIVLSLTIGTLAALAFAEQYRHTTQDVTNTIAAAMLPFVADQQETRVIAALENIIETAGIEGIGCIHVVDSSGSEMVAHCREAIDFDEHLSVSADPWSVLFRPREVQSVIAVEGLEVATVRVALSPPPLRDVLLLPVVAAGFVLVAVMFVSVPWTLWAVVRDVAEPLQQLESYSARIADGDYESETDVQWPGEIEQLQQALGSMAEQLKRQQEELRGSYDDLSAAYDSLERAKSEIEQLAAVKEDFVAVAAHEIRAPLSTIRLYAEVLKTEEVGELDERGMQAVTAISSAASRLGSITSDLMDTALLERGMMPIRAETVWLDEVVEEAVEDANAAAGLRGISVRTQHDLWEIVVRADALRLRQVLDNLLSNAIKYSPDGSEVLVRVEEDDEWVALEVADRGYGVDDSNRHRLFTLFGRVDFGTSRETAGLGLGLAISARIVEAHGGTIGFRENDGGVGSVFTVKLPKSGPSEGVATAQVTNRPVRGEEEA